MKIKHFLLEIMTKTYFNAETVFKYSGNKSVGHIQIPLFQKYTI